MCLYVALSFFHVAKGYIYIYIVCEVKSDIAYILSGNN